MLVFVGFVFWIWLAVMVFMDIFRRSDMGGFAKAMWIVFVIFIPLLGVLVYLIAYHNSIADRNIRGQEAAKAAFDQQVREAAGKSARPRRSPPPRACSTPAPSRTPNTRTSRPRRWPDSRERAGETTQGAIMSADALELGPIDIVVIGYPPEARRPATPCRSSSTSSTAGSSASSTWPGCRRTTTARSTASSAADIDGDGFPDLAAFAGASTGLLGRRRT